MKIALIIYFAEVVASLKGAAVFMSFVAGFLVFLCTMHIDIEKDDTYKKHRAISFIIGCISMFLAVITPSEKTVWLMAGGYAAEQFVTSDRANVVLDKLTTVVNQKLDAMIGEKK